MAVKGLDDLTRNFNLLEAEVRTKIARAATSAGANVLRKKVEKNLPIAVDDYVVDGQPVQKGNLPRNVITVYLKPGQSRMSSEHLVVLRRRKKDGFASRIGSLQEFGTASQPANPSFRPAMDEGHAEATAAAQKRFEKRIDAAVKKLKVTPT